MYTGVKELFAGIREKGITIGVYSDYPGEDKLSAMGLDADLVIDSTQPDIDRLKPDPAGLLYLCRHFGYRPEECLFIGDRDERDGACARNAGMPYLIIDSSQQPFMAYQGTSTKRSITKKITQDIC